LENLLGLVEVVPALSDGLPALGDYDDVAGPDYEYRTFRLDDPVDSLEKGFIDLDVN
jgi:hypothetical protein